MSDAPSAIASTSIFWMNLTTGASSVSLGAVACSSSGWVSSPAANARSRSSSTSCFSEVSELSMIFFMAARSLSSSTTTGSIARLDWNFTSFSACVSDGSAMAMASRPPRLCSGTTRRDCISFRSINPLARPCGSAASRSNKGKPNVVEANSATSRAVNFFPASNCSMKPVPPALACATRLSASDTRMRPCCTRARARPGSAVSCGVAAALIAYPLRRI